MEAPEEIDDEDDLDSKLRQRRDSITNRNLLLAARGGDIEVIYRCIEEGADINFVDRDGNTPLHYAVKSKNVETVEFFVNYYDDDDFEICVEDINAENNENRTPLDIAYALKQYDIAQVLSDVNVECCIEILKNEEDQQSDDIVNKLNFMEATFNYNYEIPLTKEDIQNILDFTYLRRDSEKVFKAFNTIEDMEKEIDAFFQEKKRTILIFNKERNVWITMVLCCTSEGKLKAYYIDSLGSTVKDLPTNFKEPFLRKGIEISDDFELKQHDNNCDSGIFSLKNAEIFNSSKENEIKENLKKLNLNVAKERNFYANILMEKKRVEDKISVCLETLQNLNENKSNTDGLNHKNANVFINFLETFALQDTFPEQSTIWTQEEHGEIKNKLIALKKEYFTAFYFEGKNNKDQISDLNLICAARKAIMKDNVSNLKQPEDLKYFIKDDISVNKCFENLELYTKYIESKIYKKFENVHSEIYCYSFLKYNKIIGTPIGDSLKILREFLLDFYQPEDKIDQEKIIFNVTANIIPAMNHNKDYVRPLNKMRNNLVHNYYEKSIFKEEKKFKEIKHLHSLRSEIFKYYYSKEVHGLLGKMLLHPCFEALQNELKKILENFQTEITKQKYTSFTSGEPSKSFEYIFQESLFPESDESMNNLVDKYLKYAFMVEIKAVQVDNEDGKRIGTKKLTDDKKREIFEDFMKLKESQELTFPIQLGYERSVRNKLKEKLKMYGLKVSYFDRVLSYYLDDANQLSEESEKKKEKIMNILSTLKQIKKEFSLSSKTIINLYESFLELKQKGTANLRKCEFILDEELSKTKLTESQKESRKSSILEELDNFPSMEMIDIRIGEAKIAELNTFGIIRNILSVFCNSYDNYKIKFNNIIEAFNDDIFLHYLVNLSMERNQSNNSKIFKDKYFVFTIIKKLVTVKYAHPYIAELLIESNDDSVIEKNDFVLLLRTLLKNNAYVKHLSKLLNVKSETLDVYGEFCNQIVDCSFNIENMQDILQDYKHVKAILNKLYAQIKNIKRNILMENEALKIEEFCEKVQNEDCDIIEDYFTVKGILCKLCSMNKNVDTERSFKIYFKKVIEYCEKYIGADSTNVPDQLNKDMRSVLCDLKTNVHKEVNYGKEKKLKTIEEITLQILKQLNIIGNEFHRGNCFEETVKILETSIEVGKKLFKIDDLKNILLDAEFQKQRSIIQLAAIEKDESIKNKNISKALRILRRLQSKDERNPKYLLISAEIANAEHLLRKFYKSYMSYKRLYEKIASMNPPYDEFSRDEFLKIESCKEYQNLLALSNESKKYLSITNLQISMAHNLECEGHRLVANQKYDKGMKNHKKALRIYEKLYSFMKINLEDSLDSEKSIAQMTLNIVKSKLIIGGIFFIMKEFELALQCYREALVKCIKCSCSLTKISATFHPGFKENKKLMDDILSCIESASAQQYGTINDCFADLPLELLGMW